MAATAVRPVFWNVQLVWLINFACDLRGPVAQNTWAALPKWVQTEWYTIEAALMGTLPAPMCARLMRSMFEERFQFTAHMEKREGKVFTLGVAKPGPGLKPHPARFLRT